MALNSKAVELVREMARTDSLPPHDEEGIREVVRSINKLNDEIAEIVKLGDPSSLGPAIIARHSTIARDKRCVLAYLMNRLWRIQHLRWELDADIPKEVLENFSQKEGEFLIHFDDMLTQYMDSVGIDLSLDMQQPPHTDLYVEVRVVRDCIVPLSSVSARQSGSASELQLHADTTVFLKRSDSEPLIRTGHLEHVVR